MIGAGRQAFAPGRRRWADATGAGPETQAIGNDGNARKRARHGLDSGPISILTQSTTKQFEAMKAALMAQQFDVAGRLVTADPTGSGNVNDTYLVVFRTTFSEERFILQRI